MQVWLKYLSFTLMVSLVACGGGENSVQLPAPEFQGTITGNPGDELINNFSLLIYDEEDESIESTEDEAYYTLNQNNAVVCDVELEDGVDLNSLNVQFELRVETLKAKDIVRLDVIYSNSTGFFPASELSLPEQGEGLVRINCSVKVSSSDQVQIDETNNIIVDRVPERVGDGMGVDTRDDETRKIGGGSWR